MSPSSYPLKLAVVVHYLPHRIRCYFLSLVLLRLPRFYLWVFITKQRATSRLV
jgi:hypothetical protein